jgi:hypothetical protein
VARQFVKSGRKKHTHTQMRIAASFLNNLSRRKRHEKKTTEMEKETSRSRQREIDL